MKEYKSLSIVLVCAAAVCTFLYFSFDTTKPERESIYNTEKLSPDEKETFTESVKTGDAYVYYGDHKKAAEVFEQAAILNPDDRQTLYRLASSQHNSGQYEEAESTLKKLEESEKNNADYWGFRASNISKKPDSLKNIKLAVKYCENAYRLAKYKDSPLFLETRAKIYFEEYKYYRVRRINGAEKTKKEVNAEEKFLNALKDLKTVAISKHDSLYIQMHDDLYNQYRSFPNGNYKSIYEDLPQLQPVEYTEADIEKIKNNMPQDNFPDKK